jgi:hypothetical protein
VLQHQARCLPPVASAQGTKEALEVGLQHSECHVVKSSQVKSSATQEEALGRALCEGALCEGALCEG